jgi:hypothetical protein
MLTYICLFSGSGGGGATGDLSEWCVSQLTKIRAADSTNNTDPSEFFGVLEYCATLQSAQVCHIFLVMNRSF